MARILFVHNTFPGRFAFLIPALLNQGHELAAIAEGGRQVGSIPLLHWKAERGSTPGIFDLAVRAETDILRGRAAAGCALQLKERGFEPDLVIGHPAWGETLFLKEVFPAAKQIMVGEFYYRATGGDVGFDPEFGELSWDEKFKVHAKNAAMAMAYAEADRIVCPTPFQASVFPPALRDRSVVIHEGIDSKRIQRLANPVLSLGNGQKLDGSKPIVTFINRTFEPMRGFHIMMRALPALLDAVPDVRVLMIGSEKQRGYGQAAPNGGTWVSHMMKEVGPRLDKTRVLFTGVVPHDVMIAALSISWAHVYYTYPFVLSWSAVEALACECLVLGSDTPPLRDAIEHNVNGLLHDFFDVDALSRAMIEACRGPEKFKAMRALARQRVVAQYDQERVCLPAWLDVIAGVLD